jgi:acetolactate synthase-1/2/3 large subunit
VPWEDWTAAAHADYLANLVPQALPGDIDMPAIVQPAAPPACRRGADQRCRQLCQLGAPLLPPPWLAKGFKTQLAPTNGAMGYGVPAGILRHHHHRTAFTMRATATS